MGGQIHAFGAKSQGSRLFYCIFINRFLKNWLRRGGPAGGGGAFSSPPWVRTSLQNESVRYVRLGISSNAKKD
jgi:hypothetical protein